MIQYSKEHSAFYLNNERFCQLAEAAAAKKNAMITGVCNSYGYEVLLQFNENGYPCHFIFKRSQTTQNGVYLPVNAIDYFGAEAEMQMEARDIQLQYEKNSIKRMMMPGELKSKIEDGYYFKQEGVEVEVADEIISELKELNAEASIQKGLLKIVMHKTNLLPATIIEKVLKVAESIAAGSKRLQS